MTRELKMEVANYLYLGLLRLTCPYYEVDVRK
jgi:hypothetical protein